MDMPLVNLKKNGLIDDYYVTDPTLFDVPNELVFDVVWLQRIRNEKLITHLDRQINSNYLYDLDDFMIGAPSYIPDHELRNKEIIMKAIADCKVLTVTSARLVKLLEAATGNVLQGKTLVCPNGFEFGAGIKTPSKPQGIVLTQSDRLALTTSLNDVMKAVIAFSERYDLRILFFGSFDEEIAAWSPKITHVGRLTLWHYYAVLSALPPMIGIAPLETVADEATLDFVNGKSDVKMVSYGGMGHPSVYSDAPPYTDSDLRIGALVENTSDGWTQALERMYLDDWRNSDREQKRVIELRNMDTIAFECWYKAIERARLTRPLTGKDIKFSSGRTSFYVEALRHMVFSQDHAFRRRLRENMPPLIVRTLRKFVMKG